MPQTLRGSFEQALRPLPSVKGVQACRLPDLKCLKRCAAASSRHSGPLPSVVKGVQACRLPDLKCLKPCAAASSRHSGHCPMLLRAFKPAVARPQMPQTLRGSFEQALMPLPCVDKGVSRHAVCQASNASNACAAASSRHSATALC